MRKESTGYLNRITEEDNITTIRGREVLPKLIESVLLIFCRTIVTLRLGVTYVYNNIEWRSILK